MRRLRAAEFHDGDTELARLIDKVVLDSGTWKMNDADRNRVEHGVIATLSLSASLRGGG